MMRPRATILALVLTLIGSRPALASERDGTTPPPLTAGASSAAPSDVPPPQLPVWALDRAERRPLALTALYGAYGTLQALDVMSSRKALAAGAREANPVMGRGGT